MSQNRNGDVFERELEEQLQCLRDCQRSRDLLPDDSDPRRQGCFGCGDMEQCELRIRYVKAVYRSMNKGEISGFDF